MTGTKRKVVKIREVLLKVLEPRWKFHQVVAYIIKTYWRWSWIRMWAAARDETGGRHYYCCWRVSGNLLHQYTNRLATSCYFTFANVSSRSMLCCCCLFIFLSFWCAFFLWIKSLQALTSSTTPLSSEHNRQRALRVHFLTKVWSCHNTFITNPIATKFLFLNALCLMSTPQSETTVF